MASFIEGSNVVTKSSIVYATRYLESAGGEKVVERRWLYYVFAAVSALTVFSRTLWSLVWGQIT